MTKNPEPVEFLRTTQQSWRVEPNRTERYSPILVPVDFGESSQRAVAYATCFARWVDAAVVLAHVVERRYAEGFLDTPLDSNPLRTEANREARKRLAALAGSAAHYGVRIRSIVCNGVPGMEIPRLAKELQAGTIVVSRRGRTGLGRLLFGTTVDDIIESAPCPVLVLPA